MPTEEIRHTDLLHIRRLGGHIALEWARPSGRMAGISITRADAAHVAMWILDHLPSTDVFPGIIRPLRLSVPVVYYPRDFSPLLTSGAGRLDVVPRGGSLAVRAVAFPPLGGGGELVTSSLIHPRALAETLLTEATTEVVS